MKRKLLIPFAASLMLAVAAVSCGKDKPVTSEADQVTTTRHGSVFVLDTLNSKTEWKGFKVFKTDNTSHFGTLKFEGGDVTVKDGALESGKFVIDMTTLEVVDLKDDAENKAKLEGHLKSGDFFETERFPAASYEITKVTQATAGDYNTVLDGNLTIKGITKPVQFNANVSVNNGEVSIATEPKDINREDFGVKFQLPVQNGLIKEEVNVQVYIKAMEQK
ncbi:YceI family protein [Chryseobacterium sp. MFBS3-17]|uniref:YceI family protein n=1 Tax=Chryseobacterium sp. MFBS3-17 TaxID=2886689 RepID=UPI001D0E7865|nr:YceI family protein [Chryseobacterium sp. MFBS3-17]MCC2591131.1 YceI family protein [Chryseobacterium sp. MFBS3-17]